MQKEGNCRAASQLVRQTLDKSFSSFPALLSLLGRGGKITMVTDRWKSNPPPPLRLTCCWRIPPNGWQRGRRPRGGREREAGWLAGGSAWVGGSRRGCCRQEAPGGWRRQFEQQQQQQQLAGLLAGRAVGIMISRCVGWSGVSSRFHGLDRAAQEEEDVSSAMKVGLFLDTNMTFP